MKVIRRIGPVIGQPISREEERTLRDELFVARWKPAFETVEILWSKAAIIAGLVLLSWMIIGVIIYLIKHHGAAS